MSDTERCCPGDGTSAHVRGCVNHPEYVPPLAQGGPIDEPLHYGDRPLVDPEVVVVDQPKVMGFLSRYPTGVPTHDESHPPPRDAGPDHQPRRGSDVEAYLRAKRETFDKSTAYGRGLWHVMDSILDEYRLAADMGMSLDEVLDYDGPR